MITILNFVTLDRQILAFTMASVEFRVKRFEASRPFDIQVSMFKGRNPSRGVQPTTHFKLSIPVLCGRVSSGLAESLFGCGMGDTLYGSIQEKN